MQIQSYWHFTNHLVSQCRFLRFMLQRFLFFIKIQINWTIHESVLYSFASKFIYPHCYRVLLILLFLLYQFYFLCNILTRYLESQASNGGFYLKWFYVSYPDIIVED